MNDFDGPMSHDDLISLLFGTAVEAELQEKALKIAARARYRAFYSTASAGDADLMDNLVLLRSAWQATAKYPRGYDVPKHVRVQIERLSDQFDQAGAIARENVRMCQTYAGLPQDEQSKMERELFDFCKDCP